MIKVGDAVKDLITGLEGVVTARTVWLYGCVRLEVQPRKLTEKGNPEAASWFDEQRLEVAQEAAVKVGEPQAHDFSLGDEGIDEHTGFEGIITAITTDFGGQVRLTIEPKILDEGKPANGYFFDLYRVRLKKRAAPPVSPSSTATSGGDRDDPTLTRE